MKTNSSIRIISIIISIIAEEKKNQTARPRNFFFSETIEELSRPHRDSIWPFELNPRDLRYIIIVERSINRNFEIEINIGWFH